MEHKNKSNTFHIASVNISETENIPKSPVSEINLIKIGIIDDANSGNFNMQVSILDNETIEEASRIAGIAFKPGDFCENITTENLKLDKVQIMDRLYFNEMENGPIIEITQKEETQNNKNKTNLLNFNLKNLINERGLFARVIRGGTIRPGDNAYHVNRSLKILYINTDVKPNLKFTENNNTLLNEFIQGLEQDGWQANLESKSLSPIDYNFERLIKENYSKYDIIISKGGTGLGPKENIPEIFEKLATKKLPDVIYIIRNRLQIKNDNLICDRSGAYLIEKTLVFALSNNNQLFKNYLNEIGSLIKHLIFSVNGI